MPRESFISNAGCSTTQNICDWQYIFLTWEMGIAIRSWTAIKFVLMLNLVTRRQGEGHSFFFPTRVLSRCRTVSSSSIPLAGLSDIDLYVHGDLLVYILTFWFIFPDWYSFMLDTMSPDCPAVARCSTEKLIFCRRLMDFVEFPLFWWIEKEWEKADAEF